MKKILLITLAFTLSYAVNAQIQTPQPSPFSKVEQKVGLVDVSIEYSRPAMRGRTIFGGLVPFGKVWRTGANANTKITFSEDVMVGDKTLVAREFESFESVAKKAKVSFHSEIIESKSVTKAIVSYSKSKKIDLIVIGAQGITGWDKLVLGSVTDGVVHRVRCPVLIVR